MNRRNLQVLIYSCMGSVFVSYKDRCMYMKCLSSRTLKVIANYYLKLKYYDVIEKILKIEHIYLQFKSRKKGGNHKPRKNL